MNLLFNNMYNLRCTSYLYLSLAQHSQLPTRYIDCKYRRVKLQFVCSQIKTATTSNTTLKSESASAFSRCRKSTNSNAQCSLTGSNSQTGVRDAAFETAQHHRTQLKVELQSLRSPSSKCWKWLFGWWNEQCFG